jgi:pimeloyl-ACP methyl ester carboxylesterase
MTIPSISNSASARSTSPALAPSWRSPPSSTPRGSRAPAARQFHEPSGRVLVSSISILRGTYSNLLIAACVRRPTRPRGAAAVATLRCTMPPPASPVLLVHGFASSFERNWREPGWVDILEESGRDVIGLDLPGHGSADKSHDPEAYRNLEASIEAVLPADGIVDAVGFSLGAGLLLTVAARHPERFGRLVVGGVGASLFRTGDPEPAARAVETGRADDDAPEAAQAFARFATAPGNDPLALAACLRRPTSPLTPAMLAGLDRPVLVVLGDRDFAGPAAPLLDALPDATLVTLHGSDHFGTPKDFRFLDHAVQWLDGVHPR